MKAMKNILPLKVLFLSVFMLAISANNANSQVNKMCAASLAGGEELKVDVRPYSGKVYLNWKEVDHSVASYYYIQKSVDGENYFIAGLKESYKLDNNIKLGFSFVDEQVDSVDYYYRVIRVSKENSEMLSSSGATLIKNHGQSEIIINEVQTYHHTAFIKKD